MALELLTLKEASAKARIGLTTLHVLLGRGEGPCVTRIAGRVFVRADRLDAWIEELTEAPLPAGPSDGRPGAALLAQAQGRLPGPEVRAA